MHEDENVLWKEFYDPANEGDLTHLWGGKVMQ